MTCLEELELPNSVTYIDYQVFNTLKNIKKVWIPSSIETWSAKSSSYCGFPYSNKNCIIYTDATEKPTGWGDYWNNYDSSTKLPVYWGATKENYENGDPIPA